MVFGDVMKLFILFVLGVLLFSACTYQNDDVLDDSDIVESQPHDNQVVVIEDSIIADDDSMNNQGSNNSSEDKGLTGTVDASEVAEINMKAKKWEFIPDTITVKEGTKVVLSIESIDVSHGILLPEFGINESLKPGKLTTVEFIADKKGTFSFSCNVYCGSGHNNMKGTLIVE